MATSNSIPASNIVNVNTNVLAPAGTAIDMNALVITQNTYVPLGVVLPFASASDVSDFFGPSSTEYDVATNYFNGYTISQSKPGLIYFSQFNTSAVAGYLRSAALTLAEVNLITSGVLTLTVGGSPITSASFNLSGAANMAAAAVLIEAAFTSPTFSVSYDSQLSAFVFTTDATGDAATITYATGTAADDLKLREADGAALSQGADALASTDVAGYMNAVVDYQRNFATYFTTWEATDAITLAFADWNTDQSNDFAFLFYDSTGNAIVADSTDCVMYDIKQAGYSGVIGIYNDLATTAFVAGIAASIDFNQTNNAPTFKFKKQEGITPTVTNETIATNLINNGYNFYGNWANSKTEFRFYSPGQITGQFVWSDEFINQIYMKKTMQATFINLLSNLPKIPYNQKGYSQLFNSQLSNIQSFVNYGAIQAGVTLSSDQAVAVNNAAGVDITATLFAQGWYLQVKDPGATVRAERGSPIINFWYTSGGAVQYINMTSTLVL